MHVHYVGTMVCVTIIDLGHELLAAAAATDDTNTPDCHAYHHIGYLSSPNTVYAPGHHHDPSTAVDAIKVGISENITS